MTVDAWRRCSACKQPIALGGAYWVCSVSTCNRKRTGLVFCSVNCWEIHLPTAKHREAWAVERTAPRSLEPDPPVHPAPLSRTGQPRRRLVRPLDTQASRQVAADEVLIIASRLKDYVRARSGFNTSDRVLERLSELVRRACDRAIERARREGRKTVLERDLPDS